MNETVNDIAKRFCIIELSIEDVFILSDSEKERIEQFPEIGICTDLELLRSHLEYVGKRCCVYEALLRYFEMTISDTQQKIKKDKLGSYAYGKRLPILQTHRDIYELMGYLTLLQMDAITTTIGLLQAQNDTERIMLSKHSYTIIYEALINNKPKKVCKEMYGYPESIVDIAELSHFWNKVKTILKKIMDRDFAKDVRNNIDAHKNNSFQRQITLYKKCEWVESIKFLSIFTKLIDTIQDYMNVINEKMEIIYEQYKEDIRCYIDRLEQIQKELKNLKT